MGLVIEDEGLQAKAKRLADLTGTSIMGAMNDAIEWRLAEVDETRKNERARRRAAMEAIAREFAEQLPPGHGATSTDHADLLYDEDGLPK